MEIKYEQLTHIYKKACEDSLLEIFNTAQAAKFIGVSKSQLENWRSQNSKFPNPPKYFHISSRIRYHRSDLIDFLKHHRGISI